MTTLEQRMTVVENKVSSIEATLEHLATKSDIAQLDAKLEKTIADLKSDLTWRMFGMVIGLMVGMASVAAAIQTFFD